MLLIGMSVLIAARGPIGVAASPPYHGRNSTSTHPMPTDRPDKELLKSLLRERNQWPDRIEQIDRTVRQTFQRRAAVLALDMCGFTQLTAKHGILFYLAMIVQMEEAAAPAVRNNRGTVVKQEADNLFALFPTAADALEAAFDIFLAFKAVNSVVPDDRDIHGSIGIGYGDLLVIGNEDVFGEEMNNACRLGEDLGKAGEILLTPAAHASLPPEQYACEAVAFDRNGEKIPAHRFVERIVP